MTRNLSNSFINIFHFSFLYEWFRGFVWVSYLNIKYIAYFLIRNSRRINTLSTRVFSLLVNLLFSTPFHWTYIKLNLNPRFFDHAKDAFLHTTSVWVHVELYFFFSSTITMERRRAYILEGRVSGNSSLPEDVDVGVTPRSWACSNRPCPKRHYVRKQKSSKEFKYFFVSANIQNLNNLPLVIIKINKLM